MSPSSSDHELLQAFACEGSQPAFAELVRRHLDLVYSAARRQVRSPQLAEEVAQSVFTDLARNAARLKPGQPLAAWLHLVTRRAAIDAIRREARRRAHEHEAATLDAMKPPSSDWRAIEPVLDEAVAALEARDRTAILLRFFENKSLRDIGATLGVSDDAAQKRVARALEQLRTFFLRRGVTLTAAGLASDLSAAALHTAPAPLASTITSAVACATLTTGAHTAGIAAMTTLQKSLGAAVAVLVAGAGFYETRLIARQSTEIATLRQQIAQTASGNRDLRLAHATAAAKLKDVEQRIDLRLAQPPPPSAADAALETQMQEWLTQITRLKDFLIQRPEWNIPELKLLSDQDWFDAAATSRIESEDQFRRATARLRDLAVSRASQKIMNALNAYVLAHDGDLPISALALAPYFDPPINPAILGRYEMLQTGKLSDVPKNQQMRLLAPKPADVEYDASFTVGTNGYGNTGVAMSENVREARRQFAKANNGQRDATAEQLLPYLKWPVGLEALQKYLRPASTPKEP
jgi:RNA polymerase sigma factor (sigma-70 family)